MSISISISISMRLLDLSARTVHLDELRRELDAVREDEEVVVDVRLCRLPLAAVDVAADFLERVPAARVCVGNNAFAFDAFIKRLDMQLRGQLFDTDRLTLGWSEQEVAIGRLAARAARANDIATLADVIRSQTVAMAERDARYERERVERDAKYEHERAERERERAEREKREDRLRERVEMLDGYHRNGDHGVEHCVSDTVDDAMRDEFGFELMWRAHDVKLYDRDGSNTGEVDGLLEYMRQTETDDADDRRVLLVVEAKSHITDAEFQKAHKTRRLLLDCIEAAARYDAVADKHTRPKWKRQCEELRKYATGFEVRFVIGSPSMPDEVRQEADASGWLVVQRLNDSYAVHRPDQWSDFAQ
jgi:hypothetical protein